MEDHGPGIPAGNPLRVLEPFYRAESAHRLGYLGVGLGWVVAERIVATHADTISAESATCRG